LHCGGSEAFGTALVESKRVKVEIERKFLLRNDSWRKAAVASSTLSDGLLSVRNNNKVRVRTDAGKGLITIKGPTSGLTRPEFEYEIPLADAEDMLLTLCAAEKCSKTRFIVPNGPHIWHVDVYDGALEGVSIAEIELAHEGEAFAIPGWIGREVTGDPDYGKWAMLTRHAAALPTATEESARQRSRPEPAAPKTAGAVRRQKCGV
jgi:adenylate cyclase